MNKPRIAWLSDGPFTNTGYATITRNVLNGLVQNGWEVYHLAHNYTGQPLPPGVTFNDRYRLNYHVYGNGKEQYNKDVLVHRINTLKPDIFCILLDTFMLYPWITDFFFSPAKSVFYYPSDGGGGLPQGCDAILRHMNNVVAMSKFGQKQAKDVHDIDAHYIPHAVDTDVYRPLSDAEKARARREWEVVTVTGAKIKGVLQGKYVVGVVARNQSRKMLDLTVKAFAEFCKDKPEAVLYLHCDPFDAAGVFDIRFLINRLKLQNRVFFSPVRYFENLEYKEMNKVYNLFDVFFLSTSGEGFGIPIIEAMACEVPVIATDYTTIRELICDKDGDCGYPVDVAAEITGSWSVERAIMNVADAKIKLDLMYEQPDLAKEMGERGRKKVLKEYSWDVVNPLWDQFFKAMIHE